MIKKFCDVCKTEITKDNEGANLVIKRDTPIKIKVALYADREGVWNDGDICKYCIIDTVVGEDDRPKEVA